MPRLNCADAWAGKQLSQEEWREWADEIPEYAGTTPAATFPQGQNAAGVWDGAGNVWEWTASRYDATRMVLRGGSWAFDADAARCGCRSWNDVVVFFYGLGFRVMVSLVSSGSEC